MTRVLLCDEAGHILFVDDPTPPEELKNEILNGRWTPAIPRLSTNISAYIRGETVLVYPINPQEKKPLYARPKLSLREKQVLEGLVNGLEQKEIAQAYGISPRRVKDCVEQLKKKFNTQSTTNVVARAVAMDICQPRFE